eukprot:TRINITY_DN32680_c0_g1_i4.p1 TRINITY_DN32680_c0_g1~~TRINITY_DN32680_c0_g1_i4.p1  ORF type:complete len:326 (+),score=71.93 TRINITY_DN32680_c0_g1_i4:729-1706(+)
MSSCHAKDSCPGHQATILAQRIFKQAKKHPDRRYSVYTTNYSRSTNFALLELGVTVEEHYQARYRWTEYDRQSSDYGKDVYIIRSVLTPAAPSTGIVVRVFHMHGIAKSLEEFEHPEQPGPTGRSTPLWAKQEHDTLGAAAKFFFDREGDSISLIKWAVSGSAALTVKDVDATAKDLKRDAVEVFDAVAEGIIISDSHYKCEAHVESLKGSFRAALDDPGRTVVIVGSSLTDEFFMEFLEENLDENTVLAEDDDDYDDDALRVFKQGRHAGMAQGLTLQFCVAPKKSFLEGTDVLADLKPYMFFFVFRDEHDKPDYKGIADFLKS